MGGDINKNKETWAMIIKLNSNVALQVKLIVIWLSLGGLTAVQAATVSFTTSWSTSRSFGSGANVPFASDSLNDFVSNNGISKFDPALGILQGIDISLSGMRITSLASANFRDDTLFSTVAGLQQLQNMSLNIQMPGFILNRPIATRTARCSDTGTLFTSSSCTTNLGTSTIGLPSTNTSLVPLSSYIGSGTVNIGINQNARLFTDETDGDNGYVNSRSGQVRASGTIRVTYDYTVVPVPAAVWLFGSGLIGLIGLSRRNKA